MPQKIQGGQRDFSSGEIDVALKRADNHPARKSGLRQMSNMRILNSGSVQNRPGRSALFLLNSSYRIEEVSMPGEGVFKLSFGATANGELRIFNDAGAQVVAFGNQGSGALLPWTADDVNQIVFAQLRNSIYITFPGMVPQVLSLTGGAWSIADYAVQNIGSQKRTLFYRLTDPEVTLTPSAQTGAIVLAASKPIFTAAHVGTRIRYVNRQVLITGVVGPYPSTHAAALVEETLPGHQNIAFSVDPTATYSIGDEVIGSVTGSRGLVVAMDVGLKQITVQLLNTNTSPASIVSTGTRYGSFYVPAPIDGVVAFTTTDTVVGPGGGLVPTQASTIDVPSGITVWDEEVMNPMRGYPASCFVDQFRLGFCDFPALPNAVAWSAVNAPADLYVGANPTDAIFELAPDDVKVRYVVPGAESSEFVFCDRKVYYIKIDASNPLRPGSVGFQTLSSDGCAQVQPRAAQEFLVYVNAGKSSVMAVVATGAYYRPFNVKNLTEYHSHLFSDLRALAIPTADGTFNERYVYALNADGSLVVGKYTIKDNQFVGVVGWGPCSGAGVPRWVSAFAANVTFTTEYFGNRAICELLDDDVYLDGSLFVNNLPSTFAPPPGYGPLWWAAGQSVTLMDQGTRSMGTYEVDASGFIVPQNNGGEDLLAASLVAGLQWTSIVEPFCPDADSGADVGQRMKRRRISNFAAYVVHSTGFVLARLFAGPITPTSPPLGTMMNYQRFPAYNQGDDATKPPPERETTERIRPPGKAFDPRVALIKDTPGPLLVEEIGIEATV